MQHFPTAGAAYIKDINAQNFSVIAVELFRYQYEHNELYRRFTDALHIDPASVHALEKIPFLPISFFKSHEVRTGSWQDAAFIFESSGTTGEVPSQHFVRDEKLYDAALMRGFSDFYGRIADYAILALLPSYLERGNSSLVHMAKVWMERSGHPANGFYLDEWETLSANLQKLQAEKQPAILLGVTFALLDFAAQYPMKLPELIIMETGGMKGRREEWTRGQVHQYLREQWALGAVQSEYGMTELLSQAYALRDGLFAPSGTMKVLVRDINDPLTVQQSGTGCLNVIDLANVHSCAFIATEDIGALREDGSFGVFGAGGFQCFTGLQLNDGVRNVFSWQFKMCGLYLQP